MDEMYENWLAGIRNLPSLKKKMLRELCGSAEEVYRNAFNIEETLLEIQMQQYSHLQTRDCDQLEGESLTEYEVQLLKQAREKTDVNKEYEKLKTQRIRFVPYYSEEYPERLKNIPGKPYALYVKGELPKDQLPAVSIVGARSCTSYGERMAMEYAEVLAGNGVQIVSGMALGIDGIAQRAALRNGGKSYAILACGVDQCYPKYNRGLYVDLQENGGVISEQPPGTPPLRELFPARNRIISGLSDAVLVMEAKKKSGSLITADFGMEQGKDVYALPGPVTSELSKGCHELIRQGAGILVDTRSFLEEMSIICEKKNDFSEFDHKFEKKALESDEKVVYHCVGLFPKSLNQMVFETGLKPEVLMRTLFALEIKGYIREVSKNNYIRV